MKLFATVAILLVLLAGGEAQAQSTPEERAKEYSAAGLEAVDQGDFVGAVEAFKKAYRIDPEAKYLFNIGRAYHVMGKFRLALDYYEKFLRENKSEKKARRGSEIIAELKQQMAAITINVEIPNATLKIDGDPELCTLGNPCMVDPGERRVEVEAAGYARTSRRLRLEAGEVRIEVIELVAVSLPTRQGAIWRSALFPGMGQFYAGNKTSAGVFLASELVSLSVMTTGLILEQYYVGQRSNDKPENFKNYNDYIDASYWTWVGGLAAAGTIWAVNLVHAWAMPMPTKPTAWRLVPMADGNQSGLTFLLSF